MAKKLSQEEQDLVQGLTKLLGKRLPVAQRKNAGGIASGLVRLEKERLSTEDVMGVLRKYVANESSLHAMEEAGALVRVKTRKPDGTVTISYLLELPEDEADATENGTGVSPAQEATPKTADAVEEADQKDDAKQKPAGKHANKSAEKGAKEHASKKSPKHAKAEQAAEEPAPSVPAKATNTTTTTTTTALTQKRGTQTLAKAQVGTKALSSMNTIRKQTPEVTDIRVKIIDLDPRLWINGWLLSVPEAYLTYESELKALSRALDGSKWLGDGTLSRRELSYQVFGDEKFLAIDSEGSKLMHCMGVTELVHCHPQPKLGMLHHIPRWREHMRIVVSENLDPWANMRDVMYRDGKKRILGERVHGVVFGDGHLANDAHKLPELVESLGAEEVELLYWGDIDRAGLQILEKLASTADGRFAVTPFVPAYQLMIRRAMERWPEPLDNEPAEQERVPVVGLDLLEPLLKKREAAYLRAVIEGDCRIPQEIVTRADL